MKLICPVCGKPLCREGKSARCENRHTFDYAASGYLNLALNKSDLHGDSKEMTAARTSFLESGSWLPLRNVLAEKLKAMEPAVTVDLCCGEGWYTRAFPGTEKYGIDLSKPALIYAAKHDKDTQYVLASAFRTPLPDQCADAVITCFAPVAAEEIRRILKPGGHFLHITGGPDHLRELKELLYEKVILNTENPPEEALALQEETMLEFRFGTDRSTLQNLFLMTPYAYRSPAAGKQRLEHTDCLSITAQFIIRTYSR
ncbi:MAG: methyltransferase domain-containing protein [Solobacterium sp.]|nr:methyltransferase domain-containing protein [Solobacterium sp.]